MYCNYCGKVIQDDANVCAYCGKQVAAVVRAAEADCGRNRDERLPGVCAGFAEYFDLDVTLVRLVWLVAGILHAAALGDRIHCGVDRRAG